MIPSTLIAYYVATAGTEFSPGISATTTLAVLVPVLVATVTAIPATIAAVGARDAKRLVREVRREVMPNGGSSSYDVLHRLVWETHEATTENGRQIENVAALAVEAREVAVSNASRLDRIETTTEGGQK